VEDILYLKEDTPAPAAGIPVDHDPERHPIAVQTRNFQSLSNLHSYLHQAQTKFRPHSLLVPTNLKKERKVNEQNERTCTMRSEAINHLPPPLVDMVSVASLAVVTTDVLAVSTASLVRLLKPRIPCQAFVSAPWTAVDVAAGMSWLGGGCCRPYP
jgi:hypothetical protein